MMARSGREKTVFKDRRSRWSRLFTEPDLDMIVLPFLGIELQKR